MTVAEAAKQMGISPSLTCKLIAEKRLSCVRIGGRGRRGKIILTDEDVKRFMDRSRVDNVR